MKNIHIFLIIVFLIIVGTGIYFYPSTSPERSPTINQGIFGKVILSQGNCMPSLEPSLGPCASTSGVSRDIYIREPATGDILHLENKTHLVKQIKSDESGFYEVELPPGTYSIFVEDLGKEYCNPSNMGLGDHGELCQITIGTELKEHNILINHVVW